MNSALFTSSESLAQSMILCIAMRKKSFESKKGERGQEISLYVSPSKQLTHHVHTKLHCANLQVCYSFNSLSVPLTSRRTPVAKIRASVHAKAWCV